MKSVSKDFKVAYSIVKLIKFSSGYFVFDSFLEVRNVNLFIE